MQLIGCICGSKFRFFDDFLNLGNLKNLAFSILWNFIFYFSNETQLFSCDMFLVWFLWHDNVFQKPIRSVPTKFSSMLLNQQIFWCRIGFLRSKCSSGKIHWWSSMPIVFVARQQVYLNIFWKNTITNRNQTKHQHACIQPSTQNGPNQTMLFLIDAVHWTACFATYLYTI